MTSDPTPIDKVSSARLVRILEEAHWIRTGGREGLYARYAPPTVADATSVIRQTVLIPLDQSAPDYKELLADAVDMLFRLSNPSSGYTWLSRLTTSPTDQFSFAKETQAPKGWIQWDEGETLIAAARSVLISGAKSAREQLTYFGNRHGQFANRFLDEVMMGQTAVGSYVVRAYIPTNSAIPLRATKESREGILFSDIDAMSSRDVSEAVVTTLTHTVEALDHFHNMASLTAFTDSSLGLSYEAVTAVKQLAENADAANITVSWDSGQPRNGEGDSEFVFLASHVPVLERAANALVAPQPQREVTAEGTVHLLSRDDVDGPGVVGITTLSGTPANKLRVHLDPEDYHRALGAHDRGSVIRVIGNLEREGNLSYLYQARISGVSETSETGSESAGSSAGGVGYAQPRFEGW